jgi:AcrR family transcriptional regulator
MKKRIRDKARTRRKILEAGAEEIFRNGFENTSLDAIIEKADSSKGAFFHYFSTKDELAAVVIDEMVYQRIRDVWIDPIVQAQNPVQAIKDAFRSRVDRIALRLRRKEIPIGCPLNSIAMEATRANPGLVENTRKIYVEWIAAFEQAIRRGIALALIKPDVEPRMLALCLLQQIVGTFALARGIGKRAILEANYEGFLAFLRAFETAENEGAQKAPAVPRPS